MPPFPIPSSMQDMEREPYNLQPYPHDFDDDDETARANSFDNLVELLENGNRELVQQGLAVFNCGEDEDDGAFDEWMSAERLQALYTLVRKLSSLAPGTRAKTIAALCQSVHALCDILASFEPATSSSSETNNNSSNSSIVPQAFRDSLACHLYMLFSVMSAVESEAKVGKSLRTTAQPPPSSKRTPARKKNGRTPARNGTNKNKKRAVDQEEFMDSTTYREACARAMLFAARSMAANSSRLWQRSVADEAVVSLPCRIAYQMLENSVNVTQRKAAAGDEALGMIAASVSSSSSLMNTVVAALMDFLHSFEHASPMVAELCCLVEGGEEADKLATELLREVGRIDTTVVEGNAGKASGIKYVAPFISELAARKPKVVLAHIGFVLPHLNSEQFQLRSSIVSAIGHIIVARVDHCSDSDRGNLTPVKSSSAEEKDNSTRIRVTNERSRDNLLDILIERIYDVNSFSRSAVLKTWATIVEHGCLPVDRVHVVTALAIDRLRDKAVAVRRSAMQLLTMLLENNPFMGSLHPEPYQEKILELETYVQKNIPQRVKESLNEACALAGVDRSDSKDDNKLPSEDRIPIASLEALMKDDNTNMDDLPEDEKNFMNKLNTLQFAKAAIRFIDLFQNANASFECMLLSSNSSDVTEALRFFVRARHFELPCAVLGMKQALQLMWSQEQNVREEVLKGFENVFLRIPGASESELLPPKQIVTNLIGLVSTATVSELASIEEAIRSLVKNEIIPAEVFQMLWTIASASSEKRASALQLVAMGASADKSLVDSLSRLNQLLETGFGDNVEETRDWNTVRAASCALQQIGRAQASCKEGSAKDIVLDLIFERLCLLSCGNWCLADDLDDTKQWFSAAEQAINAIFAACAEPEEASANILRSMYKSTFESEDQATSNELALSRFFFVLGHIALKLLVYTETMGGILCRANAAKSESKQQSKSKSKAVSSGKSGEKKESENNEGDAIEDELGMAAEQEAETERKMAEISEHEIVGRGLIGLFGPLLVRVVANEGNVYSSDLLKQSSTHAMCKFMCISRKFCEKHLPLLFTALTEGDTTLRANTVVALGDLAFRFPNAVEPYTQRIYACLRDDSKRVRRHTLMVLTHLILNDMVKVKGQVCDIALCLEDDDARIRDMSRLLFHELSKRSNNPIYNLLPDIISRLSQMDVKTETFRGIMNFLLGFIKKERQNETLVEKICQRFPTCTSISQKALLAFCLAHLKLNEKCIKCLNDNFKFYKDALFDPEVFKWFATIVTKARSLASKPEMKEGIEEWEEKLKSENEKGMENHRAGVQAQRAKKRANRRAEKQKEARNSRKARRGRQPWDGSDDDEDNSGSDVSTCDKENETNRSVESRSSQTAKKLPPRTTRSRKRQVAS